MAAGYLVSQFSTTNAIGSRVIRYFTNSDYSHVDLVMPNGNLLGAHLHGGVKERPPDYENFKRTLRLGCMVPDIDAAYAYARAQVGKPYNWKAIIDMFLHRHRKFTADQKSFFCDELNYLIYEAGGVQLLDLSDPLVLTPEEEMLSPLWSRAR